MPEFGIENFDHSFGTIWQATDHLALFVRAEKRILYYPSQVLEEVSIVMSEYELENPQDAGLVEAHWSRGRGILDVFGNNPYLELPQESVQRDITILDLREIARGAGTGIRISQSAYELIRPGS